MSVSRIRNFSIIAHIDHGKSTLADRLLELTGTVSARDSSAQMLDDMDLEAIVAHVPPPKTKPGAPFRALVFDSWFDPYLGVVVQVRVLDGTVRKGDRIRLLQSTREYDVTRLGVFRPGPVEVASLGP